MLWVGYAPLKGYYAWNLISN